VGICFAMPADKDLLLQPAFLFARLPAFAGMMQASLTNSSKVKWQGNAQAGQASCSIKNHVIGI